MTTFRRILFLCGQVGLMMLVRFYFQWSLKYIDQSDAEGRVLFDSALVGTFFFICRIFDGITDPLAGFVSDRWVRAGHQRQTLLLFFLAIPPLAVIMLFSPDHQWAVALRWLVLASGMVLFFIGYTFYVIPYWSLVDDMAGEDARERALLSNLIGLGMFIAVALAGVGSPLLIDACGYQVAALLFAGVAMILMILPVASVPASLSAHPKEKEQSLGAWKLLWSALHHRRYVAILALFCGAQMAATVLGLAAPFMAETLLGGSEKDVAKLLGSLLLSALPMFFVTPFLARRYGWQRTVEAAALLLVLIYAGTSIIGRQVVGSPLLTAMGLFVLAGPFSAVIVGLETAAILDCAREAEEHNPGFYLGFQTLFIKALNGFASFLCSLLVKLSHHPGWKVMAVRGMGLLSSVLLASGVIGYFLLRPKPGRGAN